MPKFQNAMKYPFERNFLVKYEKPHTHAHLLV
jgi:hypothetical protein